MNWRRYTSEKHLPRSFSYFWILWNSSFSMDFWSKYGKKQNLVINRINVSALQNMLFYSWKLCYNSDKANAKENHNKLNSNNKNEFKQNDLDFLKDFIRTTGFFFIIKIVLFHLHYSSNNLPLGATRRPTSRLLWQLLIHWENKFFCQNKRFQSKTRNENKHNYCSK